MLASSTERRHFLCELFSKRATNAVTLPFHPARERPRKPGRVSWQHLEVLRLGHESCEGLTVLATDQVVDLYVRLLNHDRRFWGIQWRAELPELVDRLAKSMPRRIAVALGPEQL